MNEQRLLIGLLFLVIGEIPLNISLRLSYYKERFRYFIIGFISYVICIFGLIQCAISVDETNMLFPVAVITFFVGLFIDLIIGLVEKICLTLRKLIKTKGE